MFYTEVLDVNFFYTVVDGDLVCDFELFLLHHFVDLAFSKSSTAQSSLSIDLGHQFSVLHHSYDFDGF